MIDIISFDKACVLVTRVSEWCQATEEAWYDLGD